MMIRSALAIAVVLLALGIGVGRLTGAAAVSAQQPSPNMGDMMKMHEQMMAGMKANEAKLDALVTQMNAASGTAKVDSMAAVVNEMVRQQKTMHEHMAQMHGQMMGGQGMPGQGGGRGMMRGQ